MKKEEREPVSIVVPMRNASTTVLYCLKSLVLQNYPIRQIIVIDNGSIDNSVIKVKKFSVGSKIPIDLIIRKKNKGIGASFNEGVDRADAKLVILMHSDCFLESRNEVEKLTLPLRDDPNIVATYPTIILSRKVWETYDFWEKSFFSRIVGERIAGFATKFDCVRKSAYLQIRGVDIKNFGVGNEDGDLHDKLRKIGKVVKSTAEVTHLHFLGEGFSLHKLFLKQRHVARSYGRAIRMRGLSIIHDGIILLVKPLIAILPFLPFLHTLGFIILILYSFLYTKKMFVTQSTLKDPKIIVLPLVNIGLLYYETFWIIEAFLFGENKLE